VRKSVLLIVAFAVVFLAVLVYSTLELRQHRVEVCVSFNGQQDCRIASGPTREAAQRTATDNACALLTRGMAESMACTGQPPAKITWLDE